MLARLDAILLTSSRRIRLPEASRLMGSEPQPESEVDQRFVAHTRSCWICTAHPVLRTALTTRTQAYSSKPLTRSGLRGTREWFTNATTISRTITGLQILAAEFTQPSYNDTVLTIELINEPFPYTTSELNILKSFYQSAYQSVQQASKQSTIVVAIDEAFQGLQAWENFMMAPDYANVALDTVGVAMRDRLTASISTLCSWLREAKLTPGLIWI